MITEPKARDIHALESLGEHLAAATNERSA
jgi:hypothetical protein